ncbi:LIC_11026 family protein [Leptospira sp. GIMC2001]|uniref:LIC_11026 family protein n=1 Tax=Leptospira sp. GIMC2001 TaxID=1513297 RepID=UPI00234B6CF4|nr:hypothetical protein [Leptospira sp. GIMC2001]WCL50256.1 hypothetical protein O4O04_05390 [Leptospira sp. GIMC2001]
MQSKILFWLRKKKIQFVVVIFFLYHAIFNSFTGQFLLNQLYPKFLQDGSLKANVSGLSLFYGLTIEDIKLFNANRFTPNTVFSADKIILGYNLPAVIWGRLRVGEIGLYNAKIHLIQENGIWNWQDILVQSDTSQESEKLIEEKDESNEDSNSLPLPIPISAYIKIAIENLDFRLEKRDPLNPVDLGFKSADLKLDLDSFRTTNIPYNLSAIDLIDSIHMELNPNDPILVWYKDKNLEFESPLDSHISIHTDRSESQLSLESKMNIGGKELMIRRKGKQALVLSAYLRYAIDFIPVENKILLENLDLHFQGDQWLQAQGEILNPDSSNRSVNIRLSESNINLDKLSRFLEELPITPMKLGGMIHLSPLHVIGPSNDLNLDWQAQARNIFYRSGKQEHSSKYVDLDLLARLDLDSEENPTAADPIPILKRLDIRNLRAEYNDLTANLVGYASSDSGIDLNLVLDKMNLRTFLSTLGGFLSVRGKVTGYDFSDLKLDFELNLQSFRFMLDRSQSGTSHSKAKIGSNLKFNHPFGLSEVKDTKLTLSTKNNSNLSAIDLIAKPRLFLEDKFLIQVDSLNLGINLTHLIPILPLYLREKVAPVESAIGGKIDLAAKGIFDISKKEYKLNLNGTIPGLELRDLSCDTSIKLKAESKFGEAIELEQLKIRAYGGSLGLDASGLLYEKKSAVKPPIGPYFGNLALKLFLKSNIEKYIAKGLTYRGDLYLDAKILDKDLVGEVISNNTKIIYNNGRCPGDNCKLFLVENLNADISIQHDLSQNTTIPLIDGDKARFIKTYGRLGRDNLTIHQVLGSHPSIVDAPFVYVKGQGNYPGLTSRVQYKENYLFIDGLKLSLLDGTVYGKDILVNIGSTDLAKMEYMATLQLRDIDLRQLLSVNAQKSIDDGKIKADLNISGNNLSDPIPNMDLYFSIFQIGRDFGKSALNVISTKGAIMNFITDSYAVDKVEVELSKGLVYADVLFKKSILSYMVALEDNKITQQRMPLANFLKRAESEISTYR